MRTYQGKILSENTRYVLTNNRFFDATRMKGPAIVEE